VRILTDVLTIETLAVGTAALFLVPLILILWVMPTARTPSAATCLRLSAWGGVVLVLVTIAGRL